MASARDESPSIDGVPNTGTTVPNRIFVGGMSGNTKESDLKCLFSKFGNIKSTKVIVDKAGISKGYGFVTFETEEEAQKVLNEVESIPFKDRKLNVGPAVKKQRYSQRSLESNSVSSNAMVWPAQPYTASSGFSRDSVYYPQEYLPLMWPPQYYLQQAGHLQSAQTGFPHYVYSIAPIDYSYQATGANSGSDFSESSSADTNENSKSRIKTQSHIADYDRPGAVKPSQARPTSPQCFTTSSLDTPPNILQSTPVHHLHHPILAKTVNGITVMAYPSCMMGNPVRDGSNEPDTVLTGFLHSPIASGTLTPPDTPLTSRSWH